MRKVWRECRVAGWSMNCQRADFRLAYLMSLWVCIVLSLHCWVLAPVAASHDAAGPFGWLLSDKGPFHQSQEFAEFVERYQQGFTTKYKIYRWVASLVLCYLSCAGFVAVSWCACSVTSCKLHRTFNVRLILFISVSWIELSFIVFIGVNCCRYIYRTTTKCASTIQHAL